MQFDDFDKKIKEAAEQHHPAYDEKAWSKMEKLLDMHLPTEKEDNRRIFFLLLLLLLTGGGIFLSVTKPWQSKSGLSDEQNSPVIQKTPADLTATSIKDAESKPAKNTDKPGTDKSESTARINKIKTDKIPGADDPNNKNNNGEESSVNKKSAGAGIENAPVNSIPRNLDVIKQNAVKSKSKAMENSGKEIIGKSGIAAANRENNQSKSTTPAKSSPPDINNDNAVITNKPVSDNTPTSPTRNTPGSSLTSNTDSVLLKKTDVVAKIEDEKKNIDPKKKENQKPGRQKNTPFAITFTAGPDLSTVGLSEIGKVKLSYGAGISYTLNRFTLRSGFYVSKKVYTAGPDEYHPPQHSWTYYVDLTKIDADCKVYEIPVTFSYNFTQAKNHNWFVSGGLSSYIMKKENYDLYYKDSLGRDRYGSKTLTNKNKNLFSIINLSAGYERKINNSLSFIVEPYIKIPLEGVGFGNIKLNSTGILLTLSVKPFAGKK
jgi:hypothetical protein